MTECHYENKVNISAQLRSDLDPMYNEDVTVGTFNDLAASREIARLRRQVRDLKEELEAVRPSRLEARTNLSYGPQIRRGPELYALENLMLVADDEYYDFYTNRSALISHSNLLLNFKPFHRILIFEQDWVLLSMFNFSNNIYRHVKQVIRNLVIQKNEDMLIRPLPAQLNEEFKTKKLRLIKILALNPENPRFIENSKRMDQLYKTRKGKAASISCGINISLTEELRFKILHKVVEALPKKLVEVQLLWNTYEKYVHPFVPVLDIKTFKNDIELTIVGLKLSGDVEFSEEANYGINFSLFLDLQILATFLIALRIAYCALKNNFDHLPFASAEEEYMCNPDNLAYVDANYISLAFECLTQANCLVKTSVITLQAFSLLCYYHLRSEEHACSFIENDRDSILCTLNGIINQLGMYRDWSMYQYNTFRLHPGVDFHDRERLLYTARRMVHMVSYFAVEEFTVNGLRVLGQCANQNKFVELPRVPDSMSSSALKWLDAEGERKLNTTLDGFFVKDQEVFELCSVLERLIHSTTKARVSDMIVVRQTFEDYVSKNYGDPVTYFKDSTNFTPVDVFDEEKKSYFTVLNWVKLLDRYLTVESSHVKLTLLLSFHFEQLQNLLLYYAFVRDLLVFMSISQNLLIKEFTMQNSKYLQCDRNPGNIPNHSFNHFILPRMSRTLWLLCNYYAGLVFRQFVALFIIRNRLKALENAQSPSSIRRREFLHAQFASMVRFKDATLAVFVTTIHLYFQKATCFYYHVGKMYLSMHTILSDLLEFDKLMPETDYLPQGQRLFNYLFLWDENTDSPPKSLESPQFVEILGFEYELRCIPNQVQLLTFTPGQIDKLVEILLYDHEKGAALFEKPYFGNLMDTIASDDRYSAMNRLDSFMKLGPLNILEMLKSGMEAQT